MRNVRLFAATCVLAVISAGIGGCASAPGTNILSQPAELLAQPAAIVTGGIQALGNVELPKAPEPDPEPVGKSTELYARVARGATRCWFGGEGHLKRTHIFNASAEPETRGGAAEIVIHEKTADAPDPRGARAFRVVIEPAGDSAQLTVENARFAIEEGQKMQREVRRWARGDDTCSPRAGFAAAPALTPEPPAKKKLVKRANSGSNPAAKPDAGQQPDGAAPKAPGSASRLPPDRSAEQPS